MFAEKNSVLLKFSYPNNFLLPNLRGVDIIQRMTANSMRLRHAKKLCCFAQNVAMVSVGSNWSDPHLLELKENQKLDLISSGRKLSIHR